MTVAEMLDRMSSPEIVDWMAFYKIEKEDQQDRSSQKRMLNELMGKKGRRIRK